MYITNEYITDKDLRNIYICEYNSTWCKNISDAFIMVDKREPIVDEDINIHNFLRKYLVKQ